MKQLQLTQFNMSDIHGFHNTT